MTELSRAPVTQIDVKRQCWCVATTDRRDGTAVSLYVGCVSRSGAKVIGRQELVRRGVVPGVLLTTPVDRASLEVGTIVLGADFEPTATDEEKRRLSTELRALRRD